MAARCETGTAGKQRRSSTLSGDTSVQVDDLQAWKLQWLHPQLARGAAKVHAGSRNAPTLAITGSQSCWHMLRVSCRLRVLALLHAVQLTVHFPWQRLVVKRKGQHPTVLQAGGCDAGLLMELHAYTQRMHTCM
jgi:hypothetical protein